MGCGDVASYGNVVGLKTAKKRPQAGIQPEYRFQVATYAELLRRASCTARLDTMVKSSTIAPVQQTFAITEADVHMTRKLYPLAQQGMRSGLYAPNRSSNLCNRKYCSFWRYCQEGFGGEVRGEELDGDWLGVGRYARSPDGGSRRPPPINPQLGVSFRWGRFTSPTSR